MREEPDKMISVCTLKPESLDLVCEIVNQTIEIIGRKNIKYFHIGADEVFNIAACPSCSLFRAEASVQDLFCRFVRKVVKRLDKKHNSNSDDRIEFIVWDDMFRGWSPSSLEKLKIKNQNVV